MKSAIVVTGYLGKVGGGALAPFLLSKELARAGLKTIVFAQNLMPEFRRKANCFKVITPFIRRGCRWKWPERSLASQATAYISRTRPEVVVACGITGLTRFLLSGSAASRTAVWEFTNAITDNKLVDQDTVKLLPHSLAVLSPSSTIDERIRNTYGYSGPIVRLPFWIDDPALHVENPAKLGGSDFIYLGRRDKEKGIHELIEATAKVSVDYPQVSVLIAGPGSERPFSDQVQKAGVASQVKFRYLAHYEDAMRALAQSRCLVLPSYHEGYPLVLLEACALGVPFISTEVGSVSELFRNTEVGILVTPRDPGALAEAMRAILTMPTHEKDELCRKARLSFERLSGTCQVRHNLKKALMELSEIGR